MSDDVDYLPGEVDRQIRAAYRRMVALGYRPAAPSDGIGNITVPLDELDLDAEAEAYARDWWEQEDDYQFVIGCCNHPTRPATILAVEAARLLCSGFADDLALTLLVQAVDELRRARRSS